MEEIEQVPGLYYGEVDMNEDDIIEELDSHKWTPLSASKNSRKVQHYGYLYDYTARTVNTPGPAFIECISHLQKILTEICLDLDLIDEDYEFNQCIVNNYTTGQGISKHTDVKQYGPVIGCFTLGSGATMKFTKGATEKEIYVEPSTLYIMSGESRTHWLHEMIGRKSDKFNGEKIDRERRISITFRNVPGKK